jgi:nitrate/TMAO reductase-like tetraheme cytochrome c subunit
MSPAVRLPAASLALALAAAAAAAVLATPLALEAQGSLQCQRCHGDREFLSGKGANAAADERLFVPDSILHGTRHDTLSCGSCHTNYDAAYPHQPTATTATCASCHEPQQSDWMASMHAINDGAIDPEEPTCDRCHGLHRVLGPEDRESPIHPLNEPGLCGECHSAANILEVYFTDPADSVARSAVSLYQETIHGLAIERAGLIVSATCSDCHRSHRVLPSDSTRSSVSRDSIPTTCGGCHEGVLERYEVSSHGTAFANGETGETGHEAPVCNTCHSAHGVAPPDQTWKAGVIEECGVCHERLYETYFDTYHGKVTRLGSAIAARCSDCHTAHLNLPANDPASSVHPVNRVETCAQCHELASASFVGYYPHADDQDREQYPKLYWTWLAMTSLLAGVFVFFGAHTILWLVRSSIARVRGGSAALRPPSGRAGSAAPTGLSGRAREPADAGGPEPDPDTQQDGDAPGDPGSQEADR